LRFLWFYQVQSIWLVETTWIGLAGFRSKTAYDAGVSLDCVTKYAMAQAVAAVPSLPPGVSPASEKNSVSDYSGRRHHGCGAFLNDSLNVIDFILCMCMQP
jgi:hypothetical protein